MNRFEQFDLDFGFAPSPAAEGDAPATVAASAFNGRAGKRIVRRVRMPRIETSEGASDQMDFFASDVVPDSSNDSSATTESPAAELESVDDNLEVDLRGPKESDGVITPSAAPALPLSARPANFGEALAIIEASAVFNQNQLGKLRSHVTVVAKALQKVDRAPDLTLLPCEPRLLRLALEGFHPAQARIKSAQWQSIISGLRRIQRATGWLRPVERHRKRTAAWDRVVARAAPNGPLEATRNFANFCTEVGVEPADVSHATFEGYVEFLENETLNLSPRKTVDSARQAWNRICHDNRDLGIVPLPKRPRYNLVATRKDELPAAFHSSAEAYLARCAAPDPFDDTIGRAIAPATLRSRRSIIYAGAQYLLDLGWPAERLDHVRAICTPEAVAAILREQFRRHSPDGRTWPPGAKPLASHLQTMAAQIGDLTDADLAQVRKHAKRVPKAKRGFPKKTRERLAAFDDELVLRDFVGLPRVLWREAMDLAKSGKPRPALAKAKYAIALAILLTMPLRIGELASIDFTKDFRRDRKGRIVGLYVPGERTKTGMPIEADIDPMLGRRIAEFYDKFIRPASHPGEDFLFPSEKSGHVSPNNFGCGLKREIWHHLGIKFNAHLARALVATIILDADPNGGPIAQRMLGHQHLDTTVGHYGMQRGRAAQRQYEALLSRTLRGRNS